MATLDRTLQLRLLNAMAENYPDRLQRFDAFADIDRQALAANLYYLCEHGLAEAAWSKTISGPASAGNAGITARGMDFLADDGGLSAILGVVTVKLHEETLKQLLIDGVNASQEPPTIKQKLVEAIRSLPAEATKLIVLEAAKAGLQQLPNTALWLGKLVGL